MVRQSTNVNGHLSSEPLGSEKNPIPIDPVVVYAKSIKQQLLSVSDEYYYYNVEYWRKAMAYMRRVGDKDGKFAIYMKRLNYGRGQWAKGVFGLIGGIVGAVLTVEAFAVASVGLSSAFASGTTASAKMWNAGRFLLKTKFRSISTYYNMGINAGVQAAFDKEGFRGINIVSVAAEGLSPTLGAVTTGFEWSPFSKDENNFFRVVGYNKSIPETIFDASTHFGTGYIRNSISKEVNKSINTSLEKSIKTHFASPIFQIGYQFILQGPAPGIKEALGITVKEGNADNEKMDH